VFAVLPVTHPCRERRAEGGQNAVLLTGISRDRDYRGDLGIWNGVVRCSRNREGFVLHIPGDVRRELDFASVTAYPHGSLTTLGKKLQKSPGLAQAGPGLLF